MMIRFFVYSRLVVLLLSIFIVHNFYAQTAGQEAQQMLDLVNGIRADHGLDPVVLNANLNQAAYDHSYDMATHDYFSHTGLNGSNFSQRVVDAGYTGSPRGENIAAGNAGVTATFNQWLNSSGHLSNMLNADANEMGIGHASDMSATYVHYWTQIFGKGSNVLSTSDVASEDRIKVYPNPVKDMLHIHIKNTSLQSLTIKLIAVNGQVLFEQTKSFESLDLNLDLSHLSAGIYFLNFQNITRKIVKL